MRVFDQRTRQVVVKLIEKPVVSQKVLASETRLSKTQLDYVINKINKFLIIKTAPPIQIENNFYTLIDESRNFFVSLFSSEEIYKYVEMDVEDRKKYIFLMLFYHTDDYLSVNHFLESLKIGKTTFINDLKKLEQELESIPIKIKYNRKDGYSIEGRETDIRYFLMKTVLQDFGSENSSFLYDCFLYNEGVLDKNKIFDVAEEVLTKNSINLVENRLNEFSYILSFMLPRLDKSWIEFYDKYSFQTFYDMKEYQFAKEILSKFKIENKYNALYICGWVLGMAIGNVDENTPDHSIINELVGKIFERFEKLSGIRFKNKQAVMRQLYSHFRPAYYRLFFKLPIINPLNQKIIQQYANLFQIVRETMKPIENLFGTEIPDEEISFLTIHFASLIDNNDEYQVKRKVGIIVCPNGIGSSTIVYNELKNLFPDIIFIGPIETNQIYSYPQNYDMIFTTVPNVRLYTLNRPVYTVNPIMSIEEKYHLTQEVQNHNEGYIFDYNLDEIISIVEKFAIIQDKDGLMHNLQRYSNQNQKSIVLGQENHNHQSLIEDLSIADIVKPEFIQLGLRPKSWEEAFYLAATPLINQNVVSRRYIDKIIQTTYREGPYMVITEKVALPHARPEDGVKDVGLGITVLKDEIKILGKTPVKYIFTLAAVDNKKHLSALADLVSLLDQKSFFRLLDESESKELVYQWITDFVSKK